MCPLKQNKKNLENLEKLNDIFYEYNHLDLKKAFWI